MKFANVAQIYVIRRKSLTRRSTGAEGGTFSVFQGRWPPPSYRRRSPGHSVTDRRVKLLEQGNGRSLDFINGFDVVSSALLKWPQVRLVASLVLAEILNAIDCGIHAGA